MAELLKVKIVEAIIDGGGLGDRTRATSSTGVVASGTSGDWSCAGTGAPRPWGGAIAGRSPATRKEEDKRILDLSSKLVTLL